MKDGQKYRVVDTAGMRKKGKVYENIEKYSILRALTSIEKSDVILVVIDGETGIREQDKHVAGYAHEAGKGVVIVYNKWDLVDKDEKTMQKKQKEIQKSREALKTGDKVITAGGIYGKIKEIGDTYMLIEVADGVRIRVDKTSIFASAEDAQQQK